MRNATRGALVSLVLSGMLRASVGEAQLCTGDPAFERCLDAIGGRPMDGSRPRDPTRIVDDIFRTSDTPPRFAPQLTFGRMIVERSVINSPGCTGGVSSSVVDPVRFASTDPRRYEAYQCVGDVTAAEAPIYGNALDWRWLQNSRVRPDGLFATDGDGCGGDLAACGYTTPWRSAFVFDLQGAANRVAVFPVTDHGATSGPLCFEGFEYSVYLTDDPTSMGFVADGENPDPSRWNRAELVRGFLRGWTNNYRSTGTAADMAVNPLEMGRDMAGQEAISDSITTVWALPCGVEFRYVAIVPGNYGNPDSRCTFHSGEDEFDAVAGLNEDNTAVCRDADRDGFRAAACGGADCDDEDPAVNPGAVETCAATRDLNCDRMTPQCPSNTGCVNGLCVPRCVEGACDRNFRCVSSDAGAGGEYCVPEACAGMTCPDGQVCGARGCQDPCADAVCPVGQVCRRGACVDVCEGLRCPTRQHCAMGRCVPNCPCVPCGAGTTCNERTGRCDAAGCGGTTCPPGALLDCTGTVPRCVMPCEGVVCPLGTRCEATTNRCVANRCFGVACPLGSMCVDGRCERTAQPDAGPRDVVTFADVAPTADVTTVSDAGPTTMDAAVDSGSELIATEPSGCGCRASGAGGAGRAGALGALAAVLAVGARRRRRA
jgi:MYXO-CTERM domain-containing protein